MKGKHRIIASKASNIISERSGDTSLAAKGGDIILGCFVGVKTIIFDHIEIASKILILYHFCRWAILSVKHRKKHLLSQVLFSTMCSALRNVMVGFAK